MIKYLISDGTTTSDKNLAIIDSLKMRIELAPDSIPNKSVGMDKVITSINKSEVEGELQARLTDVISAVNAEYNVNLVMKELIAVSDKVYSITVTLNGTDYEISASYNNRA